MRPSTSCPFLPTERDSLSVALQTALIDRQNANDQVRAEMSSQIILSTLSKFNPLLFVKKTSSIFFTRNFTLMCVSISLLCGIESDL